MVKYTTATSTKFPQQPSSLKAIECLYVFGILFILITTIAFDFHAILIGNDDNYPIFAKERLQRWQHVISDLEGPGGGLAVPFKIATLFPSVIIHVFCQALELPIGVCQRCEYATQLGILFFGIYWLGKLIFYSPHAGFFSFIGIYNPQLLFSMYVSREGFWVWAVTPLLTCLLIKIIRQANQPLQKVYGKVLLFPFISLLIAPSCANPPLIMASLLFLCTIAIIELYRLQQFILPAISRLFIVVISCILFHLYWLLPVVLCARGVMSAFAGNFDNISWARAAASLNSLATVLFRLRLDLNSFTYSHQYYGVFGSAVCGFSAILVIGFFAILKKQLLLIFLLFMFLLTVFLAKGPGGPFGFIFLEIMDSSPILSTFRSIYDKLSLPQILFYSLFIGGGLLQIFNWLKARGIFSILFTLLFVIAITMNHCVFPFDLVIIGMVPSIAYAVTFTIEWKNYINQTANITVSRFRLSKDNISFIIKCILLPVGIFFVVIYVNPFVKTINLQGNIDYIPDEYYAASRVLKKDDHLLSYRMLVFPHDMITLKTKSNDFEIGGSFDLFTNMFGIDKIDVRVNEFLMGLFFSTNDSIKKNELWLNFKNILYCTAAKYIVIAKDRTGSNFHSKIENFILLLSSDNDFVPLTQNDRVAIFVYQRAPSLVFFRPKNVSGNEPTLSLLSPTDKELPYLQPIHARDCFYYDFEVPQDGFIYMLRNFDVSWKLKNSGKIILPKKIVLSLLNKDCCVWPVKGGEKIQIYYSYDKIAHFCLIVSIIVVVIYFTIFITSFYWRRYCH